ncbi:IRF3 factor, partial [Crotophaga sulcirostris]|nr:IRF3 factor [Crotophaga sulcirostris]
QAWARASGRYEGHPEDPAKWKTNFRCALTSTRMFKLLEDNSKCGDDPHKVFAVVLGDRGAAGAGAGGEVSGLAPPAHPTAPPAALWHSEEGGCGHPDPVVGQQPPHQRGGSPTTTAWALHPSVLGVLLSWGPAPGQNVGWGWLGAPILLPFAAGDRPPRWAVPPPCHPPVVMVPVLSPEEAMLFAPAASPVPPPPPPPEGNTDRMITNLDVSIYYRGKLVHQEEVRVPQCLLVYQTSDPAVALRPGHAVRFPSPAELADGKQRRFTEELLGIAGLQLEQRNRKLFATRLKKCKVFWALSQQLDGAGEPPDNPLCRDQETPIFDFTEFCTELREFRNGQRKRSPDFTIYLCFGQSFSNPKPKESKLILVKLVPKLCEHWYEQVLREGASSLDSGTVSLQLSDSFSLYELIEHYSMQTD